jgi:hypothetical protein
MIFEAKLAAGSILAGVTGLFATSTPTFDLGWLRPVVELGSFGIIAFAAVYVLMRVAPEFIRHLDKSRDAFIAELRDERVVRERHFTAINSDLHSIDKSIQSLEKSVTQHLRP